ncbi:MAG: NADH-quinone oxidoreductase subunit N [Methanomassiliicoccaceae archaeon]|jgi:NADH-quinone oxidoreductase subunit N|nr:NADH-quinone oxidoreductase subunit N [Methanomassiliicoccaceae archaeon]
MVSFDITAFIDYVKPIAPHLILIVAALLAPAIGSRSEKMTAVFMTLAALSAIGVTAYMMYDGYTGTFAGMYSFNDFAGLMALLFLTVLSITSLMSVPGTERRRRNGEYFSLLAIATVGMMLVCSADELISLFIGIELASIMSFALVAMKKNDPRSSEAAVKYLITGGLSTALFIYGMSLIYGLTGTLNISGIIDHLAAADVTWSYMIATVTLLAGFGFKIGMVPFHAWVPDVYDGAPTPVTTFLAIGSKKMGFVVFFKIFLMLFMASHLITGTTHQLQWVFAILAAITMTVGNIVAVSQTSVKRMLAYSSIAQAGYILIVLPVATDYAMMGGLFYMIAHVFMKGGAFVVVAALAARGVGENISDYRGLSKRAPLLAFAMLLFLFSLAGIPPLVGFDAKFILFSSALEGGTWTWLVAVAVINSAISLYYYAKVVKAMYVDKGTTKDRLKIHFSFKVAVAVCAVAVVVIGVFPGPIIDLCGLGADAFLHP